MGPPWPDYRESTKEFREFYQIVAMRLGQFAQGRNRTWFEELILKFEKEYSNWEFDDKLRNYLIRLHACPTLVRLVGHAYLHMGYDLPRVIGDTLLRAESESTDQLNPAGLLQGFYTSNMTRLHELWNVYLDADRILIDAFAAAARSIPGCSGIAFRTGWRIARCRDLLRSPALWILLMRREAWHTGEKIAARNNPGLISELLADFTIKSEPLFGLKVDPLQVILELKPPQISWEKRGGTSDSQESISPF